LELFSLEEKVAQLPGGLFVFAMEPCLRFFRDETKLPTTGQGDTEESKIVSWIFFRVLSAIHLKDRCTMEVHKRLLSAFFYVAPCLRIKDPAWGTVASILRI
jgi:hypothetical protein